MAGTDIAVKKYVVRLSAEEREQLQALLRKGKSPARRLLKARILLKADVSDAGEGWRTRSWNSVSSSARATQRSGARSKKLSQAASPAVLGHPAEGQCRLRSRDGRCARRLHAAT